MKICWDYVISGERNEVVFDESFGFDSFVNVIVNDFVFGCG